MPILDSKSSCSMHPRPSPPPFVWYCHKHRAVHTGPPPKVLSPWAYLSCHLVDLSVRCLLPQSQAALLPSSNSGNVRRVWTSCPGRFRSTPSRYFRTINSRSSGLRYWGVPFSLHIWGVYDVGDQRLPPAPPGSVVRGEGSQVEAGGSSDSESVWRWWCRDTAAQWLGGRGLPV